MKPPIASRSKITVLLFLCVTTLAAHATNDVWFCVTDLGTLGGTLARAFDINDRNQVVGNSTDKNGLLRPFIWRNGQINLLPDAGQSGHASAINDRGLVLGWVEGEIHSVIWSNGIRLTVAAPYAQDINNRGWATGGSGPGGLQAWLYKGTNSLKRLNLGGCCSFGGGISDAGILVGSSRPSPDLGCDHAYRYFENTDILEDLGTLGGCSSRATHINDHGDIVGYSEDKDGFVQLTLWQQGEIVGLGPLQDVTVYGGPLARLNNRLQIVGQNAGHALLWEDGEFHDLNDFIPADSGWELKVARSINDAGLIVGEGRYQGQTRAFLLRPIRLSIVANDPSAAEGPQNKSSFRVVRQGCLNRELSLPYIISGTATAGTDYSPLSGWVTFPPGSNSATIVVSPLHDTVAECSETITVTLVVPFPSIAPSNTATVTIHDNDLAKVTISAIDATASEIGSNRGRFRFKRVGCTAAALTVHYTGSGTATPGSDYASLSGSIQIPASATAATVQVVPVNDPTVESIETVVLTLSPNASYRLGTPSSATVYIESEE